LGPRTGFGWSDAWRWISGEARKKLLDAQRATGAALAPLGRLFWKEMSGRAQGAGTPQGGAARFVRELMAVVDRAPAGETFRFHLVAHSAGSIYLARLYDASLRSLIARSRGRASLASIRFLAPAVSVPLAGKLLLSRGRCPVPPERFTIHTLSDASEATDSIHVYPSSLLTYVADHLESSSARVPVLGIRADASASPFARMATIIPTRCAHHGDLDNLAAAAGEASGMFDEIVGAIRAR
ncbi:MAG: hypothetical protein H0W83_16800, partial [Planctomycetes bacterium]|nr:hypothetical protein [Planctomycetota bacterium]